MLEKLLKMSSPDFFDFFYLFKPTMYRKKVLNNWLFLSVSEMVIFFP